MNIITLKVVNLLNTGRMNLSAEQQTFVDANEKRVDALIHAIKAGESFYKLKQMFITYPNKNTVFKTEIGTFTGWLDFLSKENLSRSTVDNYIFMYEHEQEFKEMKLISKDPVDLKSGAAGHRKVAAIKAVKWYLQRIAEEGEHIRGTLTACDYQKYIQEQTQAAGETKMTYKLLKSLYESYKIKYEQSQSELTKVKAELNKLKLEKVYEEPPAMRLIRQNQNF